MIRSGCIWDVKPVNKTYCQAEMVDKTSVLGKCYYRQCWNLPINNNNILCAGHIVKFLKEPVKVWPQRRNEANRLDQKIAAAPTRNFISPGQRLINLRLLQKQETITEAKTVDRLITEISQLVTELYNKFKIVQRQLSTQIKEYTSTIELTNQKLISKQKELDDLNQIRITNTTTTTTTTTTIIEPSLEKSRLIQEISELKRKLISTEQQIKYLQEQLIITTNAFNTLQKNIDTNKDATEWLEGIGSLLIPSLSIPFSLSSDLISA